jgi:hypothetical protein
LHESEESTQSPPERHAWPDIALGRTTLEQAIRFPLVAMLHGRAAIAARQACPCAASNVALPRETERSELEPFDPKVRPMLAKKGRITVAQSLWALDENAAHSMALAQ